MISYGKSKAGTADHTKEIIGDIPCKVSEKHQGYQRNGECWQCKLAWVRKLPWYSRPYSDEDEVLFALLGLPEYEKEEQYTVTIKDCWADFGEHWEGYTCELFGVRIGESDESDNPNTYGFWRLRIAHAPRLVVHLLRIRYCYEPQIAEYSTYLEVKILPSLIPPPPSIEGLSKKLAVNPTALSPLLRARERLFSLPQLVQPDLTAWLSGRRFVFPRVPKGRGEGTGDLDNVSPDEMTTALACLYIAHQDRNIKAPSQYELAAYYGKDRSTIYRYLVKRRIDWQEMKSAAEELAQSLPFERMQSGPNGRVRKR